MLNDFKDLLPQYLYLFSVMEKHAELGVKDVENSEYHKTLANSIARRLYRVIVSKYDESLAKLFAETLINYNEQIQKK